MEKAIGKIYKTVVYFIVYLGIIFTGFLFVSAVIYDAYSSDMDSQLVLFRNDNQLWTLAVLALFGVFSAFSALLCTKNNKKCLNCHLFLTLIWILGLGLLLIYYSRTAPAADAMSVYAMAESFAAGDLSFVHPTDSYLAYYPQQIGLVVFYAPVLYVWNMLKLGLPGFLSLEILNVFLAMITVVFQFKSLDYLASTETSFIRHLYLFMAGVFLPLIAYTSFVYGEIPSLMFMSGALYYALKFINKVNKKERGAISIAILMTVFSALAVFVKKNSLIFVIAIASVLAIEFVKSLKPAILASLAGILVLSILGPKLLLGAFERAQGVDIPSGVTPLSYVAMGMQNSSRANGWYNGFNYNTYAEAGLDADIADRISKDAIDERRAHFADNKKEAYEFYKYKYLSQWTDGTYAARQAILASSSRKEFVWSYFNGPKAIPFINYCNGFQTVFFAGLLLFCLVGCKNLKAGCNLTRYLGIITLFGTFLFHIFWEANSRYSFPAVALVLPYAVAGPGMILESIKARIVAGHNKGVKNEE